VSVVQERVPVARGGTCGKLMLLLSCIRIDEVMLLQGTPMLGAFFAMGDFTIAAGLRLCVFAVASCLLVAHVFVLNDWSGANTDLKDPHRAAQVYVARGISSRAVAALCIVLLMLSLVLLAPFGYLPVALALAVAAASALYSAPRLALKGVPFASSALHVIGGLAHFLLGYAMFHALDARSVGVGSFFALTFAAGHLTHESRDCAGDALNGIRTNAVRFGVRVTFVASFALFTLADALLAALALADVVPRVLALVAATYPLHLWWTLQTWKAGLVYANLRRLQQRYRTLYALIGIAMMLATRVAV